MKIIFHEKYRTVYTSDPAAAPGRIEAIIDKLKGAYEFVEPEPATEDDLKLAHTDSHIAYVRSLGVVYDVAVLAVGGAIKAAQIAYEGEPAFGVIRPPGHHASRDSCWGFCYFNNIAIAILKLMKLGLVKNALIIDIDLHFGDGTVDIFSKNPNVRYYHLPHGSREKQLEELEEFLKEESSVSYDIIGISAGFDRHEADWGRTLKTEDYKVIGRMIKDFARKTCNDRVFAVLEGGYNHNVLGINVKALIEGLER